MEGNETVVATGDATEVEQPVNAEVQPGAESAETQDGTEQPTGEAKPGEPKPENDANRRPRSGWLRKLNDKDEQIADLQRKLEAKGQSESGARKAETTAEEFDEDRWLADYAAKHPDHSYEKTIAALTREVTRQESERTLKVREEQQTQARQHEAQKQSFIERVDKAKSVHADFEEVAFNPDLTDEVKKHAGIDWYVSSSSGGLELLYHFGTDAGQKDFERIAQLKGSDQLEALVELKLKLAPQQPATEEKPAVESTRAPRPLSHTKPSGAANDIKPGQPGSDTLSDEEWFKKRQEQKRKR